VSTAIVVCCDPFYINLHTLLILIDLDNRAAPGGMTGAYGTARTTDYGTGSTGYGTGSTNAGPHDSNMANKLDPRVDSDLDNRGTTYGGTAGTTGAYGTGAGNTYGTTGTTGYGTGSTNAGHHSSNMANKLDPRVDSDMDNRGAYGGSTGTFGTGTSTNAGPHDSNIANKLDPRFDSDLDNRARHEAMAGSSYNNPGPAAKTAGPHGSDMLNKLDPRVDSDLDNSRTIGSQRQY
jgi:hypothetical protein